MKLLVFVFGGSQVAKLKFKGIDTIKGPAREVEPAAKFESTREKC